MKGEKATFYIHSLEKLSCFLSVITWISILRKNVEIKYFKNLLSDMWGKSNGVGKGL